MISEIFKSLLITSLAGSALAAIISLLRPITKKIFGYSWHYYIWLCVLFVMLMPVRFNVKPTPTPSITTQTVQTQQTVVSEQHETTENIVQTDTAQKPQLLQKATVIWDRIIYNRMNILAYLWLIVATALMLLNVVSYVRLNIKIRKTGEVISCPETEAYTDRKINVRVWENVASPFMTGVFRPTLILPKTELSEEQLHNILRHEMTHFKRHDILYKWFAEFVKCVHWFNPVVWYVSKQIAAECEISCDMSVTKNMTDSEEMSYVGTILSLLPTGKSKQLPLTTQMASSKKILKRRFIMIRNKKTTSRFMSIISAVIAVVMLSTTVFASGVLSDLTADDYMIEILNNGEKIELTNKPFIENDEVYVPLREIIEKSVSKDDGVTNIKWNDGTIDVTVAYYQGESGMYRLKIGSSQLGLMHISFDEHDKNFDEIKNNAGVGLRLGLKQTPVLKKSTTYIPLRNASYMLYSFTNRRDENNELYELTYGIFDKNGNDITVSVTDAMEADKESGEMTNPFRTTELFFAAFYNQDFEKMKRYCTQNCIDNFFGDDYVFGMKKAMPLSIGTVDNLAENGFADGEWAAQVKVQMTPDENSVFDPNQTETSFYMILKQQDGRYLIDEFATGL